MVIKFLDYSIPGTAMKKPQPYRALPGFKLSNAFLSTGEGGLTHNCKVEVLEEGLC